MAGIRAGDGMRLWDVRAQYESRPILNDRTVYAQPGVLVQRVCDLNRVVGSPSQATHTGYANSLDGHTNQHLN